MSWKKNRVQALRPRAGVLQGKGARPLGGMVLLATAALGLSGCKFNDVSREGPTPAPSAVKRADANFPQEAVVCADLPGTLEIAGTGFSPLPINTLREDEGLALPKVTLVDESGGRTEVPVSALDVAAGKLTVAVAAKTLPPGTYDVEVLNPNGQSGVLDDAVRVVPPPVVTAIDPNTAFSGTVTPVSITGNHFRSTGDGVRPTAFFTPVGGTGEFPLEGVELPSATQLAANVPATMEVGRYDVTVRNPEGCQATLPDAFEVVFANQIDLCATVNPGFGWVQSRTTIEICASNANGKGLLSTPEAFILIGGQEIPLLREAYLSAGSTTEDSLMSAVIPSKADNPAIAVGGPYAIRVVNPDGKAGIIPNAFTVLADPPPHITSINPGRVDKAASFTLTVVGSDFKDPVEGTPVLSLALINAAGQEFPCGPTTVTQGATATDPDTATCTMTAPATTGGYVVRARHEDDKSFDLYSMLAVTESSRKLSQTTVSQPTLNTARRAHGIAQGTDDLGNRFLYVLGGENGTNGSIDTGEVASVSRFGQLGQWQVLRNKLPEGRTGVSLVRVGRFLYAIGGSIDGSSPVATNDVLRAHILGSDSAPVLSTPTAAAGGSLAEGTWYYRVSAVMADGTVNPSGEGLPSDTESIKVPASGAVTLSWAMPVGAPAVKEYRIYRSAAANQIKGNEVLLATVTAPTSTYTDNGSVTPGADLPLPVGSLGVWVPMPGLTTKRFDAGATVVRMDADNVFLYVTGGRSTNDDTGTLKSTEEAVLSADGSSISSWRAGPDMATARAEHIVRPVTRTLAESLPAEYFGIVSAAGTSCARNKAGCAQTSIESARLQTGVDAGKALPWAGGGALASRVGATAMVVNDFFYAFNGWSGSGGSFANSSEKSGSTLCMGTTNCTAYFDGFSSATMSFVSDGVRYRSATDFFGAYFYFVGGSSALDKTTTSNVVLRGSY